MFRTLSFTSLIVSLAVGLGLAASASGAASATAVRSMPACHTSDLSGVLEPGSPGAGQRYATLALRNRSHHTCHTYGYVGMLFLDRHGHALPTDVVRASSYRPHRVVVAPGTRAATLLHWSVIPGVGDRGGRCETPYRVEVTPPDQTTHLIIRWSGGQVCERGRVSVIRLAYAGR